MHGSIDYKYMFHSLTRRTKRDAQPIVVSHCRWAIFMNRSATNMQRLITGKVTLEILCKARMTSLSGSKNTVQCSTGIN